MEQREHHVQDSLERYAVARLQEIAEDAGVAITHDSAQKYADFRRYADERGIHPDEFDNGEWPEYKASLDKYLPIFFERLRALPNLKGEGLDFVDVEAAFRNANKKGDFIIHPSRKGEISVSLKNYRKSGRRPQLSSGTFNSFVLNFFFEPAGVGWFVDPTDRSRFQGSNADVRDAVMRSIGQAPAAVLMRDLDELNRRIRAKFLESSKFEYFDRSEFKASCMEVGAEGAQITLKLLRLVDPARVKARLLKMTSLDGEEESLLIYPDRATDSLTVDSFRKLRSLAQDQATSVRYEKRGQGIEFELIKGGDILLAVHVPFTINRNGAWVSGKKYDGKRLHPKEGVELYWGQRRPRKSRELATSTNTYADHSKTGIFGY